MARKKENKNKKGLVEVKREIGVDYMGGPIRKSFYGKTLKDADEKYLEYMKKNGAILIDDRMTLERWADVWLETYKEGTVSDTTYKATYVWAVNKLKDRFGNRRMTSIRTIELQKFFKDQSAGSASSVDKIKMVTRAIFKTALNNEVISKNPMEDVQIPKGVETEEKRTFTSKEYRMVLDFAKTDPDGIGPFIILKTGLRRGELMALKWSDIDFKNMVVSVQHAARIQDGRCIAGPPKSKKSIRSIPVDIELIQFLQEVGRVRESIYVMGHFHDKKRPKNPDTWKQRHYDKFMGRLLKKFPDIPDLTPHELRHTFGSILYTSGVDIYRVSKILGHSSVDITTKIYVHTTVEDLRQGIPYENLP